jgi:hypothetical protein
MTFIYIFLEFQVASTSSSPSCHPRNKPSAASLKSKASTESKLISFCVKAPIGSHPTFAGTSAMAKRAASKSPEGQPLPTCLNPPHAGKKKLQPESSSLGTQGQCR